MNRHFEAHCDNCGFSTGPSTSMDFVVQEILPHMDANGFYCWYKEHSFTVYWVDGPPRTIRGGRPDLRERLKRARDNVM